MKDSKQFWCRIPFEARQEGQVSIHPNDPVEVLNDSNDFWWLIKDEKERLAHLNSLENLSKAKSTESDISDTERKLKRADSGLKNVRFAKEPTVIDKKSPKTLPAKPPAEQKKSNESKSSNSPRPRPLLWISKIFNAKASAPSSKPLPLLRIYAKNFKTDVKFKTVPCDSSMKFSELISISIRRFGLPDHESVYFMTEISGNAHQQIDRTLLVGPLAEKQLKTNQKLYAEFYLNRHPAAEPLKQNSARESLLKSQKRLSHRISQSHDQFKLYKPPKADSPTADAPSVRLSSIQTQIDGFMDQEKRKSLLDHSPPASKTTRDSTMPSKLKNVFSQLEQDLNEIPASATNEATALEDIRLRTDEELQMVALMNANDMVSAFDETLEILDMMNTNLGQLVIQASNIYFPELRRVELE